MISDIPQQNSSRSDLYNTVMNVVRSHLEQNKNYTSGTTQQKEITGPKLNLDRPFDKIMLTRPKKIHSLKPIPTPKQVTKYKPLKKTWDPNHTTLAWKG